MKMLNVLISNGYVSLKENEDILFERLAPSKIKTISVILSDDDYQLIKGNATIELESFNEIELLPLDMNNDQLKTYIEYELELSLNDIELL